MNKIEDLHALIDGELNSEESRRLRALVDGSTSMQAELSAISNVKDLLRQKCSNSPTDEVWKVCVVRLDEIDRSRKVESFVGKYAWAFCAGLFLLVIGSRFAVTDVKGETARAADLLQFHSSATGPSAENQRLFAQLIQNSRVNRSGVQVLSHASGMVNDVPVDKLVIADKTGRLIFFAIQNVVHFEDSSMVPTESGISGGIMPTPTAADAPRLNYVIWLDSGKTYVLAGPRSIDQLAEASVDLGLKASVN
jgi:anti-sigma factor RsiW